jgi:type II secretory pathway pseudopilin PulG
MQISRRTLCHSIRGQTLVEVLFAATILATVLMSSVRSQMSSIALLKTARETEVATEILQESMAQAFLESNAELVGAGGDYAPGIAIATHQALRDQEVIYTLPDGGEVNGFLDVRFQITWTSSTGQQRTLTLSGGKR